LRFDIVGIHRKIRNSQPTSFIFCPLCVNPVSRLKKFGLLNKPTVSWRRTVEVGNRRIINVANLKVFSRNKHFSAGIKNNLSSKAPSFCCHKSTVLRE